MVNDPQAGDGPGQRNYRRPGTHGKNTNIYNNDTKCRMMEEPERRNVELWNERRLPAVIL
jgi:hypothetical protein